MTTTDNNKLLAEFLGYTQPHPDYPHTTYWYKKDEAPLTMLSFDTDWNWLMSVVEKIEDLGNDVSITTNYIQIAFDEGEQFIVAEDTKIKIDTLYNACVEFVKWYNSSKEA
jgi:hypothetical protein